MAVGAGRSLAELCLLRRGPQDLPYSPSFTWGWLSALLALQWLVARHAGSPVELAFGRLAITLLVVVGVTRALLKSRGLLNRAEQTIAAFAATGVIFALLVLPIALSLQPPVAGTALGSDQFLLAVLGVMLFLWKLRIDAHIWQQALDLRRGAMLLAVALMVLELVLVLGLSGVTGTPESSTQ